MRIRCAVVLFQQCSESDDIRHLASALESQRIAGVEY